MRKATLLFIVCLLPVFLGAAVSRSDKPPAPVANPERSRDPFAVVELFTSEGCSSCPPADWLLGKILESARKDKERLFPLSFHVDYWNHLGWTDPFSSPDYSKRQSKIQPGA